MSTKGVIAIILCCAILFGGIGFGSAWYLKETSTGGSPTVFCTCTVFIQQIATRQILMAIIAKILVNLRLFSLCFTYEIRYFLFSVRFVIEPLGRYCSHNCRSDAGQQLSFFLSYAEAQLFRTLPIYSHSLSLRTPVPCYALRLLIYWEATLFEYL